MSQKTVRSILLVALVIVLSACSALPSLASTSTPASTTSTNSIVNKLGLGLLKLEETSNAISASQAKDLLPLWKAVRSLGADRTASQEEIEALYAQMQESLTADQLQYITELNLSSSEISSLVQKSTALASQDITQGATTQSTRTSSSSSSTGGPGGGPGGDMGGGPGGGGIPGVDTLGAGATTSSTQTTSQSLAKATAAARASSISSTTNVQLAGSIIQLLEKRVNA